MNPFQIALPFHALHDTATEVTYFCNTVDANQTVGSFDVSMDDAMRMQKGEALANVLGIKPDDSFTEGAQLRQQRSDGTSWDVFHHHVKRARRSLRSQMLYNVVV